VKAECIIIIHAIIVDDHPCCHTGFQVGENLYAADQEGDYKGVCHNAARRAVVEIQAPPLCGDRLYKCCTWKFKSLVQGKERCYEKFKSVVQGKVRCYKKFKSVIHIIYVATGHLNVCY
jgi:hypothetical protein